MSVLSYRHGPATFPPIRSPPRYASGAMSVHGAALEAMELDNRYREDNDPGQARERDGWMAHVGRHHFARCGTWRPIMGNRECPECPPKCPGCGSWYVTPKPPTP